MAFMRAALVMDPSDRLSSRDAVCHPLFEGLFEDYALRYPHLVDAREATDANGSGGGGTR